jgi:dipeptidyl aminopeptidase/acylaminoacyl peptidase
LEGVLIYPADYEPGKKYPMITYVYERLSDGLHQYQVPSNTSPYNQQHFSQAGYFVFMPDIVYEARQPGHSAVTCIEAGLKAVFARNVGVDSTKVGLTGHSWGGYETVFTATHSKMFAAYVAGAPLTELISMYSSFYWNWGQTNQVIFEVSQGRMHVPFWEDMRSYIDNSPLFHAGDISAPMLVEVGTVDGAVDWHQGQYLYNTLRRMGKNMVMLVYANENHGLAQPANMKDYAMRARHFFDVYLKGEAPQKWVNEGVPFIRLGEELAPKKEGSGG